MSIKLSYFPIRGRAEVPRLVMKAAGKDFDDNRVPLDKWAEVKPTTPFGSVPVLEVEGEQFGQGMAIANYLARENGMYGSSNLEALRIDQIHQLREDLIIEEIVIFKEKDADKKAQLVKKMNDDSYPRIVGHFNRLIKENKEKNKDSKFAVGNKLSLADIVIAEGVTTVVEANPDFIDKYPEVKAIREYVSQLDGVKDFWAARAVTAL